MWDEIIYSTQTSTAQWNGYEISSHIVLVLLGIWLFINARICENPCQQKEPIASETHAFEYLMDSVRQHCTG